MYNEALTVKEVAELLGTPERTIRYRTGCGMYPNATREQSNKGGSELIKIPLSDLPDDAQATYLRQKGLIQNQVPDDGGEFTKAPETKRNVALERLGILQAWDKYLWDNRERTEKTKLSEEFAAATSLPNGKRVSVKTLYRWQKDYRENGLCGLLPDWGRRDDRHSIDDAAYEYFCALYLTEKKRSVRYCYDLLKSKALEMGWLIPGSVKTLQRIANEIPEAVRVAACDGKKAAYDNCLPYTERDIESVKGNQVWVGDHFIGDFFIAGPKKKKDGSTIWTRPWFTMWMDFRSRKMVGWHIDFTPSTGTIISAFANAALNPNIGLPQEILTDNGRDYCSKEFAGRGHRKIADEQEERRVKPLIEHLGVGAHFAIPENARAKPIEREFRTFAEHFCKEFASYCGSRPEARPEDLESTLKGLPTYNLTMDDLKRLFSDWVQYVKNKQVSEGKGRKGECPDETFARTRLPLRLAPMEAMRLLFQRHTQAVKVNRCMVKFRGQNYFHADLALHKDKHVYIRYREEDLSVVSVYSLKDERLLDAQITTAIPAFGATPEQFAVEGAKKKAAREKIYKHPSMQAAKKTKVDSLEAELARRKRLASPEMPADNVVIPVAVGQNILDSARQQSGRKSRRKIDIMSVLSKN